ncbi:MAG: hypothetical protein ACYC7D_11750 [Nitrososphaerales archaeon]
MRVGSRSLTIIVAIFAAIALVATVYAAYVTSLNSYSTNISYTVNKLSPEYDYSCGQHIQGLYVILKNHGSKTVDDFSVSISSPLCKGAVPPLPQVLNASFAMKFYVYSTQTNGTISVSGNNTLIEIKF